MVKCLIFLVALMVSACGMQGDLYLPDEGPDVGHDAGSEDSAGKASANIVVHKACQKT